jgi:FkbM family methyltransferase
MVGPDLDGLPALMPITRSRLLAAAKSIFRAMGLEVSFAGTASTQQNVLRSLFRRRSFTSVLDVGANAGQYGLLIRDCGYRGPIISFEPLAAAHARLLATAAGDPHWIVAARAALGAGPAKTLINVAANSVSSSLLGMTSRHLEVEPQSQYARTEEIEVVALDDCFERYAGTTAGALLKIDAQGYEMEVLRGARHCLSAKIDVVQTELSLVELYENQALMHEVCSYLKEFDFRLRDIIPGLKDARDGQLLQLDGIFVKER